MALNSLNQHMLDTAAAVTLKALGGVDITTTTAETGVSLNVNGTAYWSQGKVPDQTFAVNIQVNSFDTTTGDETYVFAIQVDSELAFGDAPEAIWSSGDIAATDFTAPNNIVANIDADTITRIKSDATHIRIIATLGGTTPILNYAAWIAPALST